MAQARIEGLEFLDWDENDYAVVDETGSAGFTRIYMERAGSLQPMPVPPRNSGMADTLDEAKAALVKRYEEVKNGGSEGPQRRRVPGYEVGTTPHCRATPRSREACGCGPHFARSSSRLAAWPATPGGSLTHASRSLMC